MLAKYFDNQWCFPEFYTIDEELLRSAQAELRDLLQK